VFFHVLQIYEKLLAAPTYSAIVAFSPNEWGVQQAKLAGWQPELG
jgi:hypothetical protein